MSRVIIGILLIALIGVGGYLMVNYQFDTQYEDGKLSYIKITPRGSRPDNYAMDTGVKEPAPRA